MTQVSVCSRFAVETVALDPALMSIRKFGTDMDSALSGGLGDIFTNAEKFWCTQHIQQASVR